MSGITIRQPLMIEIDGAVYDLTFNYVAPDHPDGDGFWIAEVYDELEDGYWVVEPPLSGVTLGACIDAVIREALR